MRKDIISELEDRSIEMIQSKQLRENTEKILNTENKINQVVVQCSQRKAQSFE